MKKLIIACSLVAFASAASFAQTSVVNAAPAPQKQAAPRAQMTPEQMQQRETQSAERQAKFFQKQYGLDETQYKGVYEANLASMKSMDAFRAQGKQPTREEQEKIMNDRDESFKKAMSADQYAKYSATRQKAPLQKPVTNTPQAAPVQK